ncbi:MAG: type II toxin-antitoxin system VapC family toxin [Rubrobacteraceae bacterium]
MKLLLDTHIFPWYISGDSKLPSDIRDPDNEVYLSVASVWEAIVKHRLGKLPLPESAERYLPKQRIRHEIESLPLDEESVARLGSLPSLHRDPFDRMLVCQALRHELVLATVDGDVRKYPAPVMPRNL